MPVVSEFYGIKIFMDWNDQSPPHFHAEYGSYRIVVSIEDSTVLKGIFPFKQLKLVLAWNEIHQDEIMKNWKAVVNHGEIKKIDPLR